MSDTDMLKMLQGIDDSAIFLQLFHPSMVEQWAEDVTPLIQLGAAIMLDKPIVVIVEPGRTIPATLRRIADEIIETDLEHDPAGSAGAIGAALERLR